MASTRGISELVLIVADVMRAARFYREVVGLTPETEVSEEWAWFWAGSPGVPQRLALRNGPLLFEEHSPHPEGHRWGQVHFALEVERVELEHAVQRVRGAGVNVFGPTRLAWMKAEAFYFFDLDANLVELWSPDPE